MKFLFVTVDHVPISYLNNVDIFDIIKKSHTKLAFLFNKKLKLLM